MIVLVGFMGAGKSTVGRLVAARLGLPFLDADEVIAERLGESVSEYFARAGEPAFRDVEEAVVADLLTEPDAVLSLGGGACERPRTRARLRGHDVVHLHVSFDEALRRVGGDLSRPVLADPALAERYATRETTWVALTDLRVDVDGRSPEQVAELVLERCAA